METAMRHATLKASSARPAQTPLVGCADDASSLISDTVALRQRVCDVRGSPGPDRPPKFVLMVQHHPIKKPRRALRTTLYAPIANSFHSRSIALPIFFAEERSQFDFLPSKFFKIALTGSLLPKWTLAASQPMACRSVASSRSFGRLSISTGSCDRTAD